jgi:hypothetical protein
MNFDARRAALLEKGDKKLEIGKEKVEPAKIKVQSTIIKANVARYKTIKRHNSGLKKGKMMQRP